ncbi:MAG: VOC family protein [Gemmatimonadaceae bacterium]|nr:VOC family protein [Gemmatimonadaceae bacterium]
MLCFSAVVPVLRVGDIARSVSWYTTILGFTSEALPDAAMDDRVLLRRDHTELVLRRAAAPAAGRVPRSGEWDLLIRLSGDALVALLDAARRQTPLVRGPELMSNGEVHFELEDPDGHRVCVSEVVSDTRGIPRAVG